jgi:hypothetical protein
MEFRRTRDSNSYLFRRPRPDNVRLNAWQRWTAG